MDRAQHTSVTTSTIQRHQEQTTIVDKFTLANRHANKKTDENGLGRLGEIDSNEPCGMIVRGLPRRVRGLKSMPIFPGVVG